MSAPRAKTMLEFNGWLAAFDRLLPEDRNRSIQLIEAYNGAVAESRSADGQTNLDPFRLFSRDEVESLVGDYRSNRLSSKAPAMKHYLELLEQGYKWPALM
jgi:hypothetical protein